MEEGSLPQHPPLPQTELFATDRFKEYGEPCLALYVLMASICFTAHLSPVVTQRFKVWIKHWVTKPKVMNTRKERIGKGGGKEIKNEGKTYQNTLCKSIKCSNNKINQNQIHQSEF